MVEKTRENEFSHNFDLTRKKWKHDKENSWKRIVDFTMFTNSIWRKLDERKIRENEESRTIS